MNPDFAMSTPASSERGYRAISDYALIGDCRTAALIAADASIDWLCLPTFDAPAWLSRIIGAPRGGYWSITEIDAESAPLAVTQRYLPDTAIVETTIRLRDGQLRIIDFMPTAHVRTAAQLASDPCVIRQIEAVTGPCQFALRLKVAPDYARTQPHLTRNAEGVVITGGQGALVVSYIGEDITDSMPNDVPYEPFVSLHTLAPGERLTVALSWAPNPHQASRLRRTLRGIDWQQECEATAAFWQTWAEATTYHGPYRDLVVRSAITLKLLTFAPTGAIVAAPTTSLPELIGGPRNWDYRYTWMRDGALTASAFASLGHLAEARAFVRWVEHRERRTEGELRVLYGIQGERETPEVEVPPLEGYRKSLPVRIGNTAMVQQQHDLYGEWLDCVAHLYLHPDAPPPDRWLASLIAAAVTHICDSWMEPDAGIWEVRSLPQHFVHSKMLCWIGMERGITLAEYFHWEVDLARWHIVRDNIARDVWEHGRDPDTGRWKISYEFPGLDASVLMASLMGFVAPTDPSMLATTEAIMQELVDPHGFVFRYRQFDDGVGGEEGTFLMCSGWLAEVLALQGRQHEARLLFEQLLSFASPTGLFSEMIDPITGQLLGNYPQAFSHLSIIRVALALAASE